MAHRLEQFYSAFGGVDTRSNPLTQNPKAARVGSKNFLWNYKDRLQRRYGFQHKTAAGDACEAGLIEYKLKDINTGESRTEILGVSFDGRLRKKNVHKLKLTVTAASVVTYYSFYYDAPNTTHKIIFYNSSQVAVGTVNVSLTMALGSPATASTICKAINDLAITGLSADVVDEDGASVVSTVLAYLIDVTYLEEFDKTGTDIEYNEAWYFTEVLTPNSDVAFINAVAFKDSVEWEGISYVNANNACYITDGGFVFKYDGYRLYRAGMPKILQQFSGGDDNYSGFQCTVTAGGTTTAGDHRYRFQLRYKDPNGIQVFGKVQPLNNVVNDTASLDDDAGYQYFTSAAGSYFSVRMPNIKQDDQFPVYAAEVTSTQVLVAGSNTIAVAAGHNIIMGMALRLTSQITSPTFSLIAVYCEITAVTATSITFNLPATLPISFGVTALFPVNACYVPDEFMGQYEIGRDIVPYGSTYFILATKVTDVGTWYIAKIERVPFLTSQEYSTLLDIPDAALSQPFSDLVDGGFDLPRSCRYLSLWQNQLVQAGRPIDPTDASDFYPTLYDTAYSDNVNKSRQFTYSESGIADFQSIYWADFDNVEGFSQGGDSEESFENNFNDRVKGMAQNKDSFFVFKQRTTAFLSGTLATGDLVKEFMEVDVGSANHNCIQEVRGAIVFMDQNMGFWSVVAGRLPQFIGYPIQDYFKQNNVQARSAYLNFQRAQATNFRFKDQYICYIPAGKHEAGEAGSFPDPTSSSLFFALDYSSVEAGGRSCWYVWQDVNAAGGVLSTANDELLIAQKQSSNNRLWKMKSSGSIYDYSDHTSAIEFNYKGSFLTKSLPVIDKHWLRCVISSVLGNFALRVDQYCNFIDTVQGSLNLTFPALSALKTAVKLDAKANVAKLSGLSWGFYNNTIHQDIQIDGWEVEYSQDFDTGEPKL